METAQAWQELVTWFRAGTHISYKKGEIILRPEDSPRDLFYSESGIIKVYTITKQGDENIRVIKRPGDIFPLIWVTRPVARNAYYEALDEVEVCRRSRQDLLEYVEQHAASAMALLDQFTSMYLIYADRINNLEYRYARERIAYRLYSLMKSFGKKNERGEVEITIPLRQIDLADTTNVTRETASRELLRLKKHGIIDYSDNRYVILQIEKLQKEFL